MKLFSGLSLYLKFFLFAALIMLPLFSVPAGAQALDPASTECLKCHTPMNSVDQGLICHQAGCAHQTGLDYVTASSNDPALAAPSYLPETINLVGEGNSKIGCTTCHVPYSKANHKELSDRRATEVIDPMLSTSNARSSLCLGCHLK